MVFCFPSPSLRRRRGVLPGAPHISLERLAGARASPRGKVRKRALEPGDRGGKREREKEASSSRLPARKIGSFARARVRKLIFLARAQARSRRSLDLPTRRPAPYEQKAPFGSAQLLGNGAIPVGNATMDKDFFSKTTAARFSASNRERETDREPFNARLSLGSLCPLCPLCGASHPPVARV